MKPQTVGQVKSSVLIVEDHDDLRRSIVTALGRSGFAARGVFCAEEITEAVLAEVPDIYVIDIGLPGESGLNLAARIRERQPQAGIIILTANSALNSKLDGYQSGADVYLAKPVDVEELLAVLGSLTRRLRDNRTEDAPELIIDAESNQLVGLQAVILLSEPEKRALTRFAFSSQATLERWELMEAFGSPEAPVSPRSLEVRVAALRKKIVYALLTESNPILGLRGVGYKLRPTIRLKR